MYVAIFSCVFFYISVVYGLTTNFAEYELYSENEINGNIIFSFDTSSAVVCVAFCDNTFGCHSVNFHEDDAKCLLTDFYPADINRQSGEVKVGWKIYFRRNLDVDLLEGATAWQSSTIYWMDMYHDADLAIDGNSVCDSENEYSTAYTAGADNAPYWAVEFGTPGPVKGIEIYFRTFCCYYDPNTNFIVTVSNSRDDVTNDVGALCGTYYGPAIDKAPFNLTINCESTIYGKFLKIKHDMLGGMMLCEVIVKTP